MEWFPRGDVDNIVVPKGFDGFPPFPDSWSQWDAMPFGNFKSEMKRNNMRSYIGSGDCKVTGSGLTYDVDMKNFGMQEEPFDSEAIGRDFRCEMDQWSSYPTEQMDFHLDNLSSLDQLDDVFLSSLLEECPTGRDASDELSDVSTSSHADNQAGDEHVTSNTHCAGSANKYFSAHAFTSPVDWESQEVNNSYLLEKAPLPVVAVKLEHDRGDSRESDEEISMEASVLQHLSMEASVLQHLENLTSQLTEQTRICFRDALYRLADNSKQDLCQIGNVMQDQSSRWLCGEETTESQTNVIDRTVANLLFSNIEFGVSEDSSMVLSEATNIRQQHSSRMSCNNISCSSGCDAPTSSG